jgi:hypothetical protein
MSVPTENIIAGNSYVRIMDQGHSTFCVVICCTETELLIPHFQRCGSPNGTKVLFLDTGMAYANDAAAGCNMQQFV